MDKELKARLRVFYGSRRWYHCRMRVLNAADWVCQSCGKQAAEVHHDPPIRGGAPMDWIDPDKYALRALCRECHHGEHAGAFKPPLSPKQKWLADLRQAFTNQPKEVTE